ncbi:hypothetical protein AVEN_74040-1 [Araneus ventricosus]|uniref:Uncharacterized protein n=1 Tax=Araneus ventricosus TaxID=182803 RepID=A0A4Y2UA79_ARAVE|nr:hypothetical protein AVEN_233678-1 [Araneus ventricosus]GBO09905.1 hypothetical protein AVEN_74040-1 [Araneus ventricosus]
MQAGLEHVKLVCPMPSSWCGAEVWRRGACSGVIFVISPRFKITRPFLNSLRVAVNRDVNITHKYKSSFSTSHLSRLRGIKSPEHDCRAFTVCKFHWENNQPPEKDFNT